MILQATHTHLFPGHRGKITGLEKISDPGKGGDCLVAFSDGSATPASMTKTGNGWQLDTQPYRTAAGTEVAAKRWRIQLDETDGEVRFRILARADSA